MARIEITNGKQLHHYMKECKLVLVMIRFGLNENWYKLPKGEAKSVIANISDDNTPEELEIYGGQSFGSYDEKEKTLYLG